MPGTDTTCSAVQTPTRLRAALSWMPLQLALLFVVLVALDLACQLLRPLVRGVAHAGDG